MAAAVAVARLNAQLVAQGLVSPSAESHDQHGQATDSTPAMREEISGGSHSIKESKERDEFVADIEINDVMHRSILTKGSFQTQVL